MPFSPISLNNARNISEQRKKKVFDKNVKSSQLTGKVFFIGLHKTGTSTLYNIFNQQSNIIATHRADWWYFRNKNLFANAQVWLDGYERYSETDTWMGQFKKFHPEDIAQFDVIKGVFPNISWLNATFPGAHFIVQTRNFRHWANSRMRHMCMDKQFNKTILNGINTASTLAHNLVVRWASDRNNYYKQLDPFVSSGTILKLDLYEPLEVKLRKLSKFLKFKLVAKNVDDNRDMVVSSDCLLLTDFKKFSFTLSESNWFI